MKYIKTYEGRYFQGSSKDFKKGDYAELKYPTQQMLYKFVKILHKSGDSFFIEGFKEFIYPSKFNGKLVTNWIQYYDLTNKRLSMKEKEEYESKKAALKYNI